jgi:hypothetical protein
VGRVGHNLCRERHLRELNRLIPRQPAEPGWRARPQELFAFSTALFAGRNWQNTVSEGAPVGRGSLDGFHTHGRLMSRRFSPRDTYRTAPKPFYSNTRAPAP